MTGLVPITPLAPTRQLPLENEARLVAAINAVADQDLVPYLHEAWRCYMGQAYNAAVIWIWCAISCYIRAVVRNQGEVLFAFRYGRKYETLEKIHDEEFIEVCTQMGMLELREESERYGWVKRLRERRNNLAHGAWNDRGGQNLEATANEVANFTAEAVHYFLGKPVASHQLVVETATIKELATQEDQLVQDELVERLVAAIVDRDRLMELCHDLLTLYYRSDTLINTENVRRFWKTLYGSLDFEKRESINTRVVRDSARTLGLKAELAEGQWRFEPLTEEELKQAFVNDKAFLDLRDLGLWNEPGLPQVHRLGFRHLIKHFQDRFNTSYAEF